MLIRQANGQFKLGLCFILRIFQSKYNEDFGRFFKHDDDANQLYIDFFPAAYTLRKKCAIIKASQFVKTGKP